MKILILTILCLSSFSVFSEASDFSLGVVLGTPTGVSGKYSLSDDNFLHADLSTGYSAIDYMWQDARNFDVENLKWLYGLGAVVRNGFGARGITEVEYHIPEYPFHGFANISMAVVSNKDIKSVLGFALGARYDF